jgi:hypothetical protein
MEAKARGLATKHLARRAASTTAKKAAKSAAPTVMKSKPASAPHPVPQPEAPKPLRDLVRAYWLFINLKTAKTLGLTIPTILSVHRWAMENLGEF